MELVKPRAALLQPPRGAIEHERHWDHDGGAQRKVGAGFFRPLEQFPPSE
ncbi:MAG: hypothetical protein WAV07_19920 [Candidatus Contendobacter sp.]